MRADRSSLLRRSSHGAAQRRRRRRQAPRRHRPRRRAASACSRPPPDAYTYDADGRRDPFLSLLGAGADRGAAAPRRGDGAAGLTVAEISVRGIMQSRGSARSRWCRDPTTRPTSCTRATSLLDGVDQDRHAAGARHRAGSQRSAVAREAAGGSQAAAIARGRQGVTVTRGFALFLTLALAAASWPTRPGAAGGAAARRARRLKSDQRARARAQGASLVIEATEPVPYVDDAARSADRAARLPQRRRPTASPTRWPRSADEPDRRASPSKRAESLGAPVSRVRDLARRSRSRITCAASATRSSSTSIGVRAPARRTCCRAPSRGAARRDAGARAVERAARADPIAALRPPSPQRPLASAAAGAGAPAAPVQQLRPARPLPPQPSGAAPAPIRSAAQRGRARTPGNPISLDFQGATCAPCCARSPRSAASTSSSIRRCRARSTSR